MRLALGRGLTAGSAIVLGNAGVPAGTRQYRRPRRSRSELKTSNNAGILLS